MKGRVKFFSKEKGFGFITSENNIDYFYHVSDVNDYNLVEYGDFVEFTPTLNSKGNKAIKIIVVEKYYNNTHQVHVHHTYEKRKEDTKMMKFRKRMADLY